MKIDIDITVKDDSGATISRKGAFISKVEDISTLDIIHIVKKRIGIDILKLMSFRNE